MNSIPIGWRVFGLGVMALGVVCLAAGDFAVAQPLPKDFPWRAPLADAAAAFLLCAGAGLQWRRSVRCAAGGLAVFYALLVLASDVPAVVAHPTVFGIYSSSAEQGAILAAALVVLAACMDAGSARAARLTRVGQASFGLCALLFGGAHFVYMDLTVPLVPRFLPPSQQFWAVATGIGHAAAGLAILAGVRARLAALLLTAMYASFTPLVHLPMLATTPGSHWIWAENALNLALTGAAWVIAESFRTWPGRVGGALEESA